MDEFCSSCGAKVQETSKYCPGCGQPSAPPCSQPDAPAPAAAQKKSKTALIIAGGAAVALAAVLIVTNVFGLVAKKDSGAMAALSNAAQAKRQSAANGITPGTWAVYWYLCGSDLETKAGYATADLEEMLAVILPDNVFVVIETGGSELWHNDFVNADKRERFVYSGNELKKVESLPLANMGDPETFEDFLSYCNVNYPAEKQALILWDHGGGSIFGLMVDTLHDNDILTLPELRKALEAVPAASGAYEIAGLDACLMGTIDMVDVLSGKARYMVASQEVEPGIGWDYSGLFTALAADTSMDGAALGRAICNTYFAFCQKQKGIAETVTLSTIDLTKAAPLLAAYDAVGQEALLAGCEQREAYFSAFGRAANQSQKYGGSGGKSNPFDMADLGDLVSYCAELLPENADQLLQALEDCVVYQVKGEYRARASGIACYYHYSANHKALQNFANLGTSEAFAYFYDYTQQGKLSAEGEAYVTRLVEAHTAEAPNTADLTPSSELNLDDISLIKGENVLWEFDLVPKAHDYVSDIYTVRGYLTEDQSRYVALGYDMNFQADWQRGHFRDGFNGEWYAIDGNLIYTEGKEVQLSPDKNSFYQIFKSPVLLNGEPYQLVLGMRADRVADEESYGHWARNLRYEILHARPIEANTGEEAQVASKEMRLIVPGDIIEPLFPTYTVSNGPHAEPEELPYGRITVTENTEFGMELLDDGLYQVRFLMIDYAGNEHYTKEGWYGMVESVIHAATFE